jgi:hypothetical protein
MFNRIIKIRECAKQCMPALFQIAIKRPLRNICFSITKMTPSDGAILLHQFVAD